MDIDVQNNKEDGVRVDDYELESELVEKDERRTVIRDTQVRQTRSVGAGVSPSSTPYLPNPNYGYTPPSALNLPDRDRKNPPVLLAGRAEVEDHQVDNNRKYDSFYTSPPQLDVDHGILKSKGNLDASGSGNRQGGNRQTKYPYAIERDGRGLLLDIQLPKEVVGQGRVEQEQRSRRISIDDLVSGPESRPRIQSQSQHNQSFSAVSTPTSISPATPEDHPSPFGYAHYPPGSILSPVPRPRSSLGSSARSISNRRPGPIHTPNSIGRARASPYHLTSAARYEGVGLGINMLNSPSTPGDMHSHSNSPLGSGPAQSPGSMSARRRKAPEWPEPKSARSHSFNSSVSTPRDMYQTLKTPAALRVPPTAQFLTRPGDVHSPMLIPGSASGVGPIRRGMAPSSAPPLSASINSPQIPATPRRVHLLDVPRAKVISTLNERASKYWFDPSTSDCRIYVPIPPKKAGPLCPGTGESSDTGRSSWPPAPDAPKHEEGIPGDESNVVNTRQHYKSRRGSQPDQEELPVLIFHIHRDYLVTQSHLLRSLLTATSPTRRTFPQSPNTPQARSFPAPLLRMPKEKTLRGSRVLPQRDGEPVSIYMPIPDPASFGLVLHWLYWGDTPTIERALSQGLATWQGVVKNIEYLALDDSIKRVIGKWWRTWVKTDVGRSSEGAGGGGDRKPSVSDTEATKRNGSGRGFSVESDSTGTDDEREEDGMEVDLHEGVVVKEEDDGGVGDLLKNL